LNNKKVLITGASGQLGYELQCSIPSHYSIFACDSDVLDITNTQQIQNIIELQQPDIIINSAAYTAVDKAENEVDLAWEINHRGAENLAKIATKQGIQLVQISTDFIFDGQQSSPYLAKPYLSKPLSVYGQSKLAGEQAVLKYAPNSLLIRTAWLYSSHGNNFVKSMLNLMKTRESLGIISDQIGTPTWTNTLAVTIWQLLEKDRTGIYHCSDNGVASWYDFAVAIQTLALQHGLLSQKIPIKAIQTQDYPTLAVRPTYSLMDKTKTESSLGITLPHWQTSLNKMLQSMKSL
jgi:dTDP-4-dehydrorhamnose reductase